MKLRDVKNWIKSLPEKFLEFDVVNGEVGELTRNRQESQRTSVVG